MEWQPIETAPKDGSWVIALLKDGDICRAAAFEFYRKIVWGTGRVVGMNCYPETVDATHWMPLPPPPSE